MTLAKNPAGGGNNSASSFKREASRKKADPARLSGSWVIPDDTRRALEHCELFRDFTKGQLMQIAALVEEYTLEPEEMLLTEGEPARHIMVVVEGQAVDQPKLNQGWISLGLVGPNEIAEWSGVSRLSVGVDADACRGDRNDRSDVADESRPGNRVPDSQAVEHDFPSAIPGGVAGNQDVGLTALAAKHFHHVLTALAGRQLLHHLLHLAELVEELVDVLRRGAAASGDPLPSASADNIRAMPFLRGHRVDYRFDLFEVSLVQLL